MEKDPIDDLSSLTTQYKTVKAHLEQINNLFKYFYEETENPALTIDMYMRLTDRSANLFQPDIFLSTESGLMKIDTDAFLNSARQNMEQQEKLMEDDVNELTGKPSARKEALTQATKNLEKFNRPNKLIAGGMPKWLFINFLSEWKKHLEQGLVELKEMIKDSSYAAYQQL